MRYGRAPHEWDLQRGAKKWDKPILWDGSATCPVKLGTQVSVWAGEYWVCSSKYPELIDWTRVWAYRLRRGECAPLVELPPLDEPRLRQIIREEIKNVLLSMLGRT